MAGWSGLIAVLSLCALGNVLEASLRTNVPYGAVAPNISEEKAVRSKRCVGGSCVCVGGWCTSGAQPQKSGSGSVTTCVGLACTVQTTFGQQSSQQQQPQQSASCPTCVVLVPQQPQQPTRPPSSTDSSMDCVIHPKKFDFSKTAACAV
ncbi:hypothetical protein ANCCAN_16172 [Ancylostoma caninum]|uniref:Uncharacterized protein n=1 Tax=Ancylostoma caninum TaxID=29170 RepID=A0A368G0G7_ANCCA|nr:hypothetical protein ANCCAN_16172 [Ancylostoma caninum]